MQENTFNLELCGDKHNPAFVGDGTPLKTGAKHIGKKSVHAKK